MKSLLFIIIGFVGIQSLSAQNSASGYYNAEAPATNVGEDCVAIQGYDVVSYHKDNKAVKGVWEHQYSINDAIYYFSSETNKELFMKNPEQYLPAYGGYCAFGVGMPNGFGKSAPGKYPVNPEAFKISDGQLYLFYDADDFKALPYWNKSEDRLKKMADLRWPSLKGEF